MAKAKKTKDYLRDYYENEDYVEHFEKFKPKQKITVKKQNKSKGNSLSEE